MLLKMGKCYVNGILLRKVPVLYLKYSGLLSIFGHSYEQVHCKAVAKFKFILIIFIFFTFDSSNNFCIFDLSSYVPGVFSIKSFAL